MDIIVEILHRRHLRKRKYQVSNLQIHEKTICKPRKVILIVDLPWLFTMLYSFRLQKVRYVGRIKSFPDFTATGFDNKT